MTNLVDRTDAPPSEEVRVVELVERRAIVLRIAGPTRELPRLIGEGFSRTAEAITRAGAAFAGPPFVRYYSFGDEIAGDVGFPFQGTVEATGGLELCSLPGGRAVTTTHVGSYDALGAAWDRATAWMRDNDVEATSPAWECYLTGPETPGPPITQIFWPID